MRETMFPPRRLAIVTHFFSTGCVCRRVFRRIWNGLLSPNKIKQQGPYKFLDGKRSLSIIEANNYSTDGAASGITGRTLVGTWQLHSDDNGHPLFVCARRERILTHSLLNHWHFVRSSKNQDDKFTRGVKPKKFGPGCC
jgi:hypothetical protein